MLTMHTDDPQYPELRVPVNIIRRARQRITAVPGDISMIVSSSQPVPSMLVTLRDSLGQSLQIERVEPADPAMLCTWSKDAGTIASVKISVDPERIGPGISSHAIVIFKHPAEETVILPVRIDRR
jgi:hypothetical protein